MHSLSKLAAVLVALVVTACGPKPVKDVREPSCDEAKVAVTAEGGPIDVWSESCKQAVRGELFAEDGALWFRQEGEDPLAEYEETTCAQWLLPDITQATWEKADLLVPTRWDTVVGLAPVAEGQAVVHTRQVLDDEPWCRQEIVLMDTGTLVGDSVWSSEAGVLLLGVSSGRAVLLSVTDEETRLVAVDLESGEVVESGPINVDAELENAASTCWIQRVIDGPWAAPHQASAYIVKCEDGPCLATIEENAIKVEKTTLAMPAYDEEAGLPVDGTYHHGAMASVERCRVQDVLELPVLIEPRQFEMGDTPVVDIYPTGASIVDLALLPAAARAGKKDADIYEELGEEPDAALDLIIVGYTFALAYTAMDFNEGAAAHRDIGIALPPGYVQVRPTTLNGLPAYRVTVPELPLMDTGSSCWLGRIVVRVQGPGLDLDRQAFYNVATEFGKCE